MKVAAALVVVVALSGCLRHQVARTDVGTLPAGGDLVRLGQADVHFRDEGPRGAPVVVFVHGFGSSLDVWAGLAEELRDSFRVVRLDLPGFGLSSRYEGDYDRRTLAATTLALLDELGIDRASLVAHSMGSAVALTLAADRPDRVDRVVLLAPWLYEDQVPWALRDARQPGIGELIFGLWWTEHLDWRFRLAFADPDRWVTEGMLDRARVHLGRPGSRAAALAVIRGLDLPALERRLSAVRAPVTVVGCTEDPVARPEFAARLAAELPRARHRPLAGCAHFPMVERADAVATLVREAVR